MQSRWGRARVDGLAPQAPAASGSHALTVSATQKRRDIDARQLSRGRPPRVAGRDDVSLLALGSLLASPSDRVAVAGEGRSPMTVAGPRRSCTGFLCRHRPTGGLSHAARGPTEGQPAPAL